MAVEVVGIVGGEVGIVGGEVGIVGGEVGMCFCLECKLFIFMTGYFLFVWR